MATPTVKGSMVGGRGGIAALGLVVLTLAIGFRFRMKGQRPVPEVQTEDAAGFSVTVWEG